MEMTDIGRTPSLRRSLSICSQSQEKRDIREGHGHGGRVKRCIDGVYGDRVIWVCRVTAHVYRNAQLPTGACRSYLLWSEEGGDLARQIDAVDEDVHVQDLLEGATLCRLSHIPLDNVIPM